MNILKITLAAILVSLSASLLVAQDATVKTVVSNGDGTYSVIEYPVGKEVMVNLTPSGTITGKGYAKIIRSADGTRVHFDVNGVPTTVSSYYAYAVDPSGATTRSEEHTSELQSH